MTLIVQEAALHQLLQVQMLALIASEIACMEPISCLTKDRCNLVHQERA